MSHGVGYLGSLVLLAALAADTDETRQAITMLILGLVGIAVLLSLLTIWYWRFTSPKRRALALSDEPIGTELLAAHDGALDPPATPDDVRLRSSAGDGEATHAAIGGTDDEDSRDEGSHDDGADERAGQVVPAVVPTPASPDRSPEPVRLTLVTDASADPGSDPDRDGNAANGAAVERPELSSGDWLDAWAPEGVDDEVTRARRRRSSRREILSDDDWAAAMRSAFDHYRG